jgi:XRE family aerobic/anaerobic benzoate catabolism transcriptional regulator
VHDHPLLERLAQSVRSLRGARGWSRRELSARAGISERFLADVESGGANPSVLRLADLAEALGVELAVLLGGPRGAAAGGRRHVALLGLRGAGKSSVGPLLAAELGMRFVELDARVEAATGLQLGELFVLHGEGYYRRAEHAALEQLVGEAAPCVLAVGGGLVVEPASLALLRSIAVTIWLRATPEDHWQRVLAQGDTRPMADNDRAFADLRSILAAREPFYRLADMTVETSARRVGEVVAELVTRLRAARPESGNRPSRPGA